jgi:hypothetical protein
MVAGQVHDTFGDRLILAWSPTRARPATYISIIPPR